MSEPYYCNQAGNDLIAELSATIESRRAELEAASRYIAVLQCQRNAYLTIEEERELMYAQAAYEDLRSQHATSGEEIVMSEQWTAERHAWARQLADRKDGDVQILLGYALDQIESQRAELDAARDCLREIASLDWDGQAEIVGHSKLGHAVQGWARDTLRS